MSEHAILPMRAGEHPAWREAADWMGDCHPLVEQLGSADGLGGACSPAAGLKAWPVSDFSTLQRFLDFYREQILVPLELPAIEMAYSRANSNQLRELIALDRQTGSQGPVRDFAAASRRAGLRQLRRLRPLRGERFAQRYLQAVENGQANGWHTLVYGLTLAIYSLALRPGLLQYAWQTTGGFVRSAAPLLHLTEVDCRGLVESQCRPLPAAIQAILARSPAA